MNKWTKRYLNLAREISTWSKDPSTQIGAIIIGNHGQIISQGYNGFPRGIIDSNKRLNDRETKYKYMVHGEMNAIYNAGLNGVSLLDTTLYVYGLPVCSECAKAVRQVGINKVIMQHPGDIPEKWNTSYQLSYQIFKEGGIDAMRFDLNDNMIMEN